MAEQTTSKIKHLGQLIVIFDLSILMTLFRIAVPITIVQRFLSRDYAWVASELIYMAIEGILIVVLVSHLIFKNSYEQIGLKNIKGNLFALIGNLIYLGIALGTTWGINFISGQLETMNFIYIVGHTVIYFICIAFLQEVIFRGNILKNLLGFTGNRVVLSVILSTLLFTIIHVPLSLMQTNFEMLFNGNITSVVVISFGLGLFLNVLYCVTDNLWLCMIVHGTYSSITIVSTGILQTVFRILYVTGCIIYLIYVMVTYKNRVQCEQEDNKHAKLNENQELDCKENQELDNKENQELDCKENQELGNKENQELDYREKQELHNKENQELDYRENQELHNKENQELDYKENQELDCKEKQDILNKELMNHDVVSDIESNREVVIPFQALLGKKDRDFISLSEEELSKTIKFTLPDEEIEQDQENLIEADEDLSKAALIKREDVTLPLKLKPEKPCVDLSETTVFNLNISDSIENPTRSFKVIKEESERKINHVFEAEPNYLAHLETYLGEFAGVYKQVIPTNPPIDILYFEGKDFNALVTNGMRFRPMNVPGNFRGYEYVELVMFIDKNFDISDEGLAQPENAWLIRTLRDLAVYPSQQNSYLGWGHVVANGEERESYFEGGKYCGIFIYPPVAQEDLKLYSFKETHQQTYIYNAMPLYDEEINFIIQNAGDAFYDRMSQYGISQVVERVRTNICRK